MREGAAWAYHRAATPSWQKSVGSEHEHLCAPSTVVNTRAEPRKPPHAKRGPGGKGVRSRLQRGRSSAGEWRWWCPTPGAGVKGSSPVEEAWPSTCTASSQVRQWEAARRGGGGGGGHGGGKVGGAALEPEWLTQVLRSLSTVAWSSVPMCVGKNATQDYNLQLDGNEPFTPPTCTTCTTGGVRVGGCGTVRRYQVRDSTIQCELMQYVITYPDHR